MLTTPYLRHRVYHRWWGGGSSRYNGPTQGVLGAMFVRLRRVRSWSCRSLVRDKTLQDFISVNGISVFVFNDVVSSVLVAELDVRCLLRQVKDKPFNNRWPTFLYIFLCPSSWVRGLRIKPIRKLKLRGDRSDILSK